MRIFYMYFNIYIFPFRCVDCCELHTIVHPRTLALADKDGKDTFHF